MYLIDVNLKKKIIENGYSLSKDIFIILFKNKVLNIYFKMM